MTKEIIENNPYKSAGVDIDAGNDLVDRIKRDVASSHNENVVGNEILICLYRRYIRVQWLFEIPYFEIRGVTDMASGDVKADFNKNLEQAMDHCAQALLTALK